MAKNTYFTHGTRNEQILQQNLVDEYLKMFGLDIVYIPRKLVRKDTILNDEIISEFNDSYILSAYLENFGGFEGNGDFLTKFGIQSSDEINLVISRGMYEDFVAYSMTGATNIEVGSRPQEGDLIFFPLSANLFEIKFVEHEDPFYQFGKLYTYKLKCELFQYSGETAGGDGILDSQVDEGFVIKYYYDSITGAPTIGEEVTGSITGTTAKVNFWNQTESWVELRAFNGEFQTGETLTGGSSGFSINITTFDELNIKDAYADNLDFETLGDNLLDFTEFNPFGEFGNRS